MPFHKNKISPEVIDTAKHDSTRMPNGTLAHDGDGNEDVDEDEDEDAEDGEPNAVHKTVASVQKSLSDAWEQHCSKVWKFLALVFVCGYFGYFGYAMYYEKLEHEQSIRLCWVTCVVVFFILVHYIWKHFGANIKETMTPCTNIASQHEERIAW